MEYKIVNIEAMRIAGFMIQTTMDEVVKNNPIPAFWAELGEERFGRLMSLGSDCPGSYGVCNMQTEQDMNYTIGMALPVAADAPTDLHIEDIPAGEYCVIDAALTEIHAGYGWVNEWMTKNNKTWAHGLSFEFYPQDFTATQKLQLYIPIMEL